MRFSTWQRVRFYFSFREYVPLVDMVVGPILLIVCIVNAERCLRRSA